MIQKLKTFIRLLVKQLTLPTLIKLENGQWVSLQKIETLAFQKVNEKGEWILVPSIPKEEVEKCRVLIQYSYRDIIECKGHAAYILQETLKAYF